MLALPNPCLPPVSRRNVLIQRALLSFPGIEILPVGAIGDSVTVPEKTSGSELGQQEIGNILERAWKNCVCLVEEE